MLFFIDSNLNKCWQLPGLIFNFSYYHSCRFVKTYLYFIYINWLLIIWYNFQRYHITAQCNNRLWPQYQCCIRLLSGLVTSIKPIFAFYSCVEKNNWKDFIFNGILEMYFCHLNYNPFYFGPFLHLKKIETSSNVARWYCNNILLNSTTHVLIFNSSLALNC